MTSKKSTVRGLKNVEMLKVRFPFNTLLINVEKSVEKRKIFFTAGFPKEKFALLICLDVFDYILDNGSEAAVALHILFYGFYRVYDR